MDGDSEAKWSKKIGMCWGHRSWGEEADSVSQSARTYKIIRRVLEYLVTSELSRPQGAVVERLYIVLIERGLQKAETARAANDRIALTE